MSSDAKCNRLQSSPTYHCSVCGADNVSRLLPTDPPPVRCPKCTSPYKQGVVQAVGIGSAVGDGGVKSDLSIRIETAMGRAVTTALAEGIDISNSDVIRARMLAARDRVLEGLE